MLVGSAIVCRAPGSGDWLRSGALEAGVRRCADHVFVSFQRWHGPFQ
ncbi:hypothetical protein JOF29_004683 [Kribbella aluminosa]|uniref:Uncharacterized protein n=1 Tax=Kribbella aluminosa TaxID=416017 RepID=A0ABS4UPK4_9ACTN|nr:hypothetical protein [Kribbella aluminosa]